MILVSLLLFAGAAVGLSLYLIQLVSVWRHLREPRRVPSCWPGISILKPLCGLDDDLEKNLERFAQLDYPDYELVLGVRSRRDPAWELARATAARFSTSAWMRS